MKIRSFLWTFALVAIFTARAASADETIEGRVTDLLGKPVAGAKVYVVTRTGIQQTVATDQNGRYHATVEGAGTYSIVVAQGSAHAGKQGTVAAGGKLTIDAELAIGDGEVIEVHDSKPPPVLPVPKRDLAVTMPYSDEAILSDAWAKAWLLLDLDETGHVRRLKVLKKPGYKLDEIATREAFKLTFDPARDETGKAIPTLIVFGMEWPTYGWLAKFYGVTTRIPPYSDPNPFVKTLSKVPCIGSGPLVMDSYYPIYRDCSKPDLTRANNLPWVTP
jgi:hypothetical protein